MEYSSRVSWNLVLLVLVLVNVSCWNSFYWCEGRCFEQEATALLDIKNSIPFPTGSAPSDWKGGDCCEWTRVTCNASTSRVIKINFSHVSYSSDVSSWLWYPNATFFSQFKDLETLHLSMNRIGGWVMPQELCKLRNLKELSLSHNNLTRVPPCLGNLSALATLTLGNNNLTESHALEDLCRLNNLQILHLSGNRLNGLPICMRNLSSLKTLSLDTYNFTLSLALDDVCGLRNLQEFYLGWNPLILLPHCLKNLPIFKIMCSKVNYLTALSPAALEGICMFKNLQSLCINNKELVDGSIPLCLSNLSSLQSLDLSNNQLMGSFDLYGLQNLTQLYLERNQLTRLPRLENLTTLTKLSFRGNNLSLSTSLEGNLASLVHPYLKLGSLLRIVTHCRDLCGLQNLTYLDLEQNQLTRLPHCLRNLTSLAYLNLGWNNLNASTSLDGFCMLKNLQNLYIGDNQLVDGSIPPCLRSLSSLQHLRLSNNHLMGSFDLCGLQNLTWLELDRNQLTQLPWCLGNLTSLQDLYLSNNNLNESTSLEGKSYFIWI